jgi:glycosyltransferase involved in cell wall biosynthesis
VVASDSPGILESVRHGETGFLVPHGDVDALAVAMRTISGDLHLVQRMGQAGRVFAESFTWDRAADETEAHLRATLELRARHGNRLASP